VITGIVTSDLEATIPLVAIGFDGRQQEFAAVVDTGFSGFLTLPAAVIDALGLTWLGRDEGTLADGRTELFDVYQGVLLWNGQPQTVEIEATETEPLIGMSLLGGHHLHVAVVESGKVTVEPLS
jgi:clan AA aspartic protease